MAFPFISTQTGGNSGANATSHTINLPAGIGVGDLLIVVFSTDGDAGTISGWPSGWTSLVAKTNAQACTLEVRYKIADGTEGASFTLSTTNSEGSAHTSMKIRGHDSSTNAPTVGTTANGVDTTPDPPNCNPGSAKDYLWIAVGSHDGNVSVSAAPANYTDLREDRWANANGSGSFKATRNLNATQENPGTFTMGSDGWIVNTIAVHPGSEGLNTETPTQFPNAIDRRAYHASSQLAAVLCPLLIAPPAPALSSTYFPERIHRLTYPASEQQTFATDPRPPPLLPPLDINLGNHWRSGSALRTLNAGAGTGDYWRSGSDLTSLNPDAPLPSTVYPDRANRANYQVSEQSYWSYGAPPISSAPFVQTSGLTWYPDRVDRSVYQTAEQSAWVIGAVPIVAAPFVQQVQLVYHPDRLDRPWYAAAQQAYAASLAPKPERTRPLENVDYPSRLDGRFYRVDQQLAASEISPQPERTSSLVAVEYPSRLDGRCYGVGQQLAVSELPPKPERTRPLEDAEYPLRLDGRYYPTTEQLASNWIAPQPERTRPLEDVDYPSRLDGRFYPTTQQLFVTELSPKPERTSPLACDVNPDAIERRVYPVAEQNPFAFVSVVVAAPAPTQFGAVYPDRLTRPTYAAQLQQAVVFGGPPIAAAQFTQQVELVWYPDGVVRPAYLTTQQLAVTELSPQPERTRPLADIDFPERVERRYYPVSEQLAVTAISPQPERKAPFDDVTFPERVERPRYPVTQQLAATELSPKPERTAALEPDSFPAYVDRRLFPTTQQLAVTELSPKPERKATLDDIQFPDWITRRHYSVTQQLASTELSPKPERSRTLDSVDYVAPDAIYRPTFPAVEQQTVAFVRLVIPAPDQFAPVYQDWINRPESWTQRQAPDARPIAPPAPVSTGHITAGHPELVNVITTGAMQLVNVIVLGPFEYVNVITLTRAVDE